MSFKIAILQHSSGTPPGSLLEWAGARGHRPDLRLLHDGASLPALNEFDLLVSLGGPMNVDDVEEFPWLADEKRLLREAVGAGRRCLGLCLGGQLMAQALGGDVRPNLHWEAGWHPVTLNDGRRLTVFQWHQDAFTPPAGAERIATNDITPNQGFRLGASAIGLQFHPEATADWIRECSKEEPYPQGPYVQRPEEIVAGLAPHLAEMRAWFFGLLDGLVKCP